MQRVGQVEGRVHGNQAIVGDLVEVITAVAQVQKIPFLVVAPVLGVVPMQGDKRAGVALGGQDGADSARREGDLHAAQSDIPIYVVFEDKGGL